MMDKDEVKRAAAGRWPEVLVAAGIPQELLDGRHHPCPKCQGTDRFRLLDAEAGAVRCNHCFATKCGDGLAAVQWARNCGFREAVRFVGEFCGLNGSHHRNGNGKPKDIIAAVCSAKRMPIEALKRFGAVEANRGKLTVARVPTYGPDGNVCSHFDLTADGKGLFEKGKKAGLFLPDGRPPEPGTTAIGVEGPKDASALVGLDLYAFGLPRNEMSPQFARLFLGVDIVLLPDRDAAGEDGARRTAARLAGIAASVRIGTLPGELRETGGEDVRDVIAKHGPDAIHQAIADAVEWTPEAEPEDYRPRILAGPREHEVANQAVEALARLPGLYQRGGNLVALTKDPEPPPGVIRPAGSLYLCPIDEAGVCDRLSQAAAFYQMKRQGEDMVEVEVAPPLRVARIVQSRRHWPGVPVAEGVVHAPVFLADGSVLATPGYDHNSGLYLAADCKFPAVPESPTLADAQGARDALLEIVCDFPFAGEAHRAAWLALILTPPARFAFDGPTPLGAFDANVRGSGKSKAADSIGMVHLGTELPRTTLPANDEEFRKRITSILLGGEPIVLIDNVSTMLGCASLDALLTGTSWSDRLLGLNKMTGRLAATAIWLASGNNLVFNADTARRALVCRLRSTEENPEEREGFRHPNLLGWVRQNRGRLAVAAVTVLRAYHVAGRPNMGLPQWGSFEGWSALIRNAVVWCGLEDPGAVRQEVREESDREATLLRQLLSAWEAADPERNGMTTKQAIDKAAEGHELLQTAMAEIAHPGKPASSKSLGMKLHHLKGRVVGGRWFERRTGSGGVVYWKVERSDSGTSGSSWTTPQFPADARARTHAHAHAPEGTGGSPISPTSPTTLLACEHDFQPVPAGGDWIRWTCSKCGERGELEENFV